MTYVIRPAIPTDGPQLGAFSCRDAGKPWTRDVEALIREDMPEVIRDPPDGTYSFVACVDDSVVGFIHAGASQFEDDAPSVLVRSLYVVVLAVTHEFRRQGIGTALKGAVIDVARGLDLAVTSHVHRRNVAMRELNAKLGVIDEADPVTGTMITLGVTSEGQIELAQRSGLIAPE